MTAGNCIGVDVEALARKVCIEQISRQFSLREVQALQQCSGALRERRFWEMWTLKEAYLKATGQGLSAPLAAFSFDLQTPGNLTVQAAPGWQDRPQNWWFAQWEPSTGHLASLCLRHHRAEPPQLQVRQIRPLCSETDITPSLRLLRQSF